MIADLEANKKLSPIVNELFLRGRKLNISLVFISKSFQSTQNYKTKRYTLLHCENTWEETFLTICIGFASNHSSDIELKDFIKLYKYYDKESL